VRRARVGRAEAVVLGLIAVAIVGGAVAVLGQQDGQPTTGAGNESPTPRTTQRPAGPASTAIPSVVIATYPPETEPEPDEPTRFAAGEVITVTSDDEDWAEVTVTKVREVKKYDGEYNLDDRPAKGNIYIEAFLTYTALDNGVDYNPFDWQVFADGVAADDFTYVSYGPKPELASGTLPKGRQASGWVVYEVPTSGEVLLSYGGTFSNEAPVFEVVLRSK
jgi:hypothetical protein